VGAPAALTRALAAALAHLSGRPTLFVDGEADPPGSQDGGEGAGFTLADLLGGRLRPPAPGAPTPGENGDRGPLTVVRDPTGDGAASGDEAVDLSAALHRLGADYHYLFVALPFDHPALTPQLLAYATRILVAGRLADLPVVRARLAALPLAADTGTTLSVLLIDAPLHLRPTVATLELLSEEFGAPVQGILPATSPGEMAQAMLPIGRWLVKQRIGLALGAGGAKGFAHIGAIRALRRAEIPLDAITGTSIGAWIGAALATGKPVERLEVELIDSTKQVFRPQVPLYGVSGSQALAAWSRQEQIFGQRRIEDLPTPFAASAADLTDGREIVLRRGPVWRAVLASAAIPGIYPPVRIGRHWLVDGGVVNPVPVGTARLLGADLVIAVDLSDPLKPRQEPAPGRPSSARPPRLFANILRSREIMMSEIRAHTVGEPSVLIRPRVEGLWNYRGAERFIAAGEEATEATLRELRQRFPWLGRSRG
jgi:NTE family protein